jgi:hypothetical protein
MLRRPLSSAGPGMLGVSFLGQFDVRNRSPLSASRFMSSLLTYFAVYVRQDTRRCDFPRAAVTLSPSLGADLQGCINRTREKEMIGKKALINHAAYVLVQNHKSRYRLGPYGILSVDPAHGETPPPLGCHPEVVKTRADAICTRPRSNTVMCYGDEKRSEETEERNAQLITFLLS